MEVEQAKQRQHELFTEHLPYELAMLDAATDFLSSEVREDRTREGWFRRQSAIEAFWVHARLLIEFFTRGKSPALVDGVPDPTVHHASAKDFAAKFETQINIGTLVEDKINPQISHINYLRESDPLKKLSHEMHYVKQQIDRDAKHFVDKLDAPWKRISETHEWWAKRRPVTFIFTGSPTTTSVFGSWTSTMNSTTAPPIEDFEVIRS